MRTSIVVLTALAALASTSVAARAEGPWCSYYVQGGTNCGFYSYEQCMANLSGTGGTCVRNRAYPAPAPAPTRRAE